MATPDVSLLPQRGPTSAPVHGDPEHLVVDLRGEHDISNVGALAESLARAIVLDADQLVIDLSAVRFMSVASCTVIIQAHALLRVRSRSLVLRSPTPAALRVIELCGLAELVELVEPR